MNNDSLNDEDDDDVIIEHSFVDAHASLLACCPFTLISYPVRTLFVMIHHVTLIKTSLYLMPMPLTTRPGASHIPVTADEVLRSFGDVRRRWIDAGKTNSTT